MRLNSSTTVQFRAREICRLLKAGHLIKDLFRLAPIDLELRADSIFVYLATNATVRYLSKSKEWAV